MSKDEKTKNEDSKAIAIVQDFENKLQQAIEGEAKKIPKWQVDAISKMKDKHIGSLQSQIRYLRSNKKAEFLKLYSEDVWQMLDNSNSVVFEINSKLEEYLHELKEKILEKIKIEFAENENFSKISDVSKDLLSSNVYVHEHSYMKNPECLELLDVTFLRNLKINEFLSVGQIFYEYDFNRIIGLYFSYYYDRFYDAAKEQISTLEKLFEESLSFNDLVTTHKIYQELKKADKILEKVSKHKIEKIDIDFTAFMKDKNKILELEEEIQRAKKYEFKKD